MKIALVYLGRRGAGGPISLALSQALAAQGASLAAFLSHDLETLPSWSGTPFDLHVTPTYRSLPGAAWSLAFPGRIRKLADQIAAWQPDALLFPMFHPWNGPLERRLGGLPSLVLVHDPAPHPGLTGWLYARLENNSLRRAAQCFVLSQALAPQLAQRGVPPERIEVVPHGPLPYPHPASNGRPFPPTLLFFGRITPYKGLEVLLQAFERLQARNPLLRLVIAGEGSLAPYRRWLERLANVQIFNHWMAEEEIPGLFSHATLLVLPYTGATQSGVLAIAAGYSLPVIATRAGGLPEQVIEGETGLLVSPGSVDELAGAIEQLLGNPPLARHLGSALKADYELRRTWVVAAEKILAAIARYNKLSVR
jgi:glycosyltransferase involved in cell wall biosynthesis